MKPMRLTWITLIVGLFHFIAAEAAQNKIKARQFAESVVVATSNKVIERSNEFTHLAEFKVAIPKNGILTLELNANVSGSLSGLSHIFVDECEYIPAFSGAHNLTIRCDLLLRDAKALLNISLVGENLLRKTKRITILTEVQGTGPIDVHWQGRNGLFASVSGLTTPAFQLTSSIVGGSLNLHEDRWESFVKAIHVTLGHTIHKLLRKNYRQVLDEATRSRILPYFYL